MQELIDEYLAEMLREEGRGEHVCSNCPRCFVGPAAFRCRDCRTHVLLCQQCIVAEHACNPLHRVLEWKDKFFQRCNLKSLGLRVQLGHEPGDTCHLPKRAFGDDFVILDLTGVHEVAVDFCGCERVQPHYVQLLRSRWYPATSTDPKTAATYSLLETFHILAAQSKVSGFEFYASLARLTENTGTRPPKDRYPAFMHMIRQWRNLKVLKRGGRGHSVAPASSTEPGECAVECPACPIPGKNLPPDWQDAPVSRSWMYRLFLAMDANFRLKRKKVSNDINDPSLNNGCSYFVEESAYKSHLTTHGHIPTEKHPQCNNHNAVKLANTKNDGHLAATGVGTVDCARHGMKRASSVGDLQKGERYVNMDYLLHRSLLHTPISSLTVSYDIACQYSINLRQRFETYGYGTVVMRSIRWAIPKFHIAAHRDLCQASYSLHYLPHCARVDGESVERAWALANPVASSTKEMGPGSRRDFLDDFFGALNWAKTTKLPEALLERIKEAVPQRNTHVDAFREYHAALPEEHTAIWQQAVEAWEADPTKPNPFLTVRKHVTEAAARVQLHEEDSRALRSGTAAILHEDFSSSTMISAGLDLEEQQRRLAHDLGRMHEYATDNSRSQVLERQNTLHRKIASWQDVQRLFMPAAAACRGRVADSPASHLPHRISLLLPSSAIQHVDVPTDLLRQEWVLREAQAHDALGNIRSRLEVRYHMYHVKDRFVRGQGPQTRMNKSIELLQNKLNLDAQRYRAAYDALCRLSPHLDKGTGQWGNNLQLLQDSDLRHLAETEDGEISEGRRTVSWIWRTTAISLNNGQLEGEDASANLQESLRVEWCKARARANRWTEECMLLEEEMRRVLAYHEHSAQEWDQRVGTKYTRPDYAEGADAYAHRQAFIRRAMKTFCEHVWRNVKLWVCLGDISSSDEVPPDDDAGLDAIAGL
ncbi:hypothetical protein C2E23DRAFT_942536 [Lenzites betulinus]|nr:hypothetical protein C2E23DRAFT_942536 [Lenzites betulinus]